MALIDPLALFAADAPDYINLRKAGRVAILAPSLLAFGTFVVGNDTFALYAVFAVFVGLVFADFGGPPKARARAYLTMIVLSSLAVTLGGILATLPIAGVVGMFVVVFGATFAKAFGGNAALNVAPLALGYALSVLMPPDQLLVPDRVAGWVLGGLAATVAAMVLWPIDRRSGLLEATAELAGELADLVGRLEDHAAARDRLTAIRARIASLQARLATPLRPYGPAARDIAYVRLLRHLDHAVDLTVEAVDAGRTGGADELLISEVSAAFERTQAVLAGRRDADSVTSALGRLDAAREASLERTRKAATEQAQRGAPGLEVMRGDVPLLALSHVAMWVEGEAAMTMGANPRSGPSLGTAPELSRQPEDSLGSAARRTARFVTDELDPEGVVLRNSIRAGISLAAAILLADVLPVQHGFWIALGALSVLRSSASSTYATALDAVVGTVAGFFIAALGLMLIGDSPELLWLLFPVAVAVAAYSPGAIHFAVGQAAFAVMVVILFTLLDSPGLQTAAVRVETVTIGAVTAAVLSLVLWPRGARAALGHAVAGVYRAAAAGARTLVTGSDQARENAESELISAWRRAEAAFSVTLVEHDEPIDPRAWVTVLQPALLVRTLLQGLIPTVRDPMSECSAAVDAVSGSAVATSTRLSAAAAYLDPTPDGSVEPAAPDAPVLLAKPDEALEHCIAACADDDSHMLRALYVVGWSVWIERLAVGIENAQPALDRVAAASAQGAWLRRK